MLFYDSAMGQHEHHKVDVAHAHDHTCDAHNVEDGSKRLTIAIALTGIFMLVELVGGWISGSLALIADAGHMLTDSLALVLALVAFRMARKPADPKRSFGYQRFQILMAFVNGVSLLFVVLWITYEAITRLIIPNEISANTMLAVAIAGLVVNILVFFVLHGGDKENLNLRGAALHVLGDLLGSVGAVIAALVIRNTGWTPIDPILSLVVAMLITRSAWMLVRKSAHILLEGSPDWLDRSKMRAELQAAFPEIEDIHHIHVWSLTPAEALLTMHVATHDPRAIQNGLVARIKAYLAEKLGITHATIELEHESCADGFAEPPGPSDSS